MDYINYNLKFEGGGRNVAWNNRWISLLRQSHSRLGNQSASSHLRSLLIRVAALGNANAG